MLQNALAENPHLWQILMSQLYGRNRPGAEAAGGGEQAEGAGGSGEDDEDDDPRGEVSCRVN